MIKSRFLLFAVVMLGLVACFSQNSLACNVYLSDACGLEFYQGISGPATPYCWNPLGCVNPGHPTSNQVTNVQAGNYLTDQGGWTYYNDPTDPRFGRVEANCGHIDHKQNPWLNN